jgi:hypothetical protein
MGPIPSGHDAETGLVDKKTCDLPHRQALEMLGKLVLVLTFVLFAIILGWLIRESCLEEHSERAGLVYSATAFLLCLAGITWGALPNTRIWYSIKYNVPRDEVTIAHKPPDCDWMHAPIGDKACHYKRSITPFTDEADGRITSVLVAWEKVED